MTLAAHPYAELFPLIAGDEFAAFIADIKENGLREKIVLLDGKILDGRNRYRAAESLDHPAAHGDAAYFRDFEPADGDPLKWVLSKNLARRHLNESQRAMVAARLATMRQGERTDLAEPSANLPKVAQDAAAGKLNVSPRLVRSAKAVQEKGSPALQHAVETGKLAVSQAEKAARLDDASQAKVAALAEEGKANVVRTVIKQGIRNEREEALGKKQIALPDKKYGVILADPEWEFTVFSVVTGQDRSASNHYPTSSEQEIAARDVHQLAAKDCMLALWTTDLARGIRVMELWGFNYKSYFVWVKDIILSPFPLIHDDPEKCGKRPPDTFVEVGPPGTGYWNRDRDEVLLIGTRGDFPAPAPGTQPESVWFAARPKIEGKGRGRHSAKPENAHAWIETNWPHLPKIELNARAARAGWDTWGNEAPQPEPEDENQDRFEHEYNQDAAQVSPDKAREILTRTGDEYLDTEMPAFLRRQKAPP